MESAAFTVAEAPGGTSYPLARSLHSLHQLTKKIRVSQPEPTYWFSTCRSNTIAVPGWFLPSSHCPPGHTQFVTDILLCESGPFTNLSSVLG